jgi:cytochrome c-type biogenesis protein
MDAESLRQAVEHAGLAAAGIGFLAGLLFSFNPVALASIPVSLAYVTRGRDKSRALLFGAMFILGMILTHVVLGLIAGLGGKWVAGVTGRGWGLFLGPLLIVLGLMWAGWLRIPLPSFGFRATRPTAAWGAFLLGIPFAIAVCPCVHTRVGRVARHNGRDWFGFARRGSAPRICSRPCRSARPGSLRRELA